MAHDEVSLAGVRIEVTVSGKQNLEILPPVLQEPKSVAGRHLDALYSAGSV
jgi:hypothetical protein